MAREVDSGALDPVVIIVFKVAWHFLPLWGSG